MKQMQVTQRVSREYSASTEQCEIMEDVHKLFDDEQIIEIINMHLKMKTRESIFFNSKAALNQLEADNRWR